MKTLFVLLALAVSTVCSAVTHNVTVRDFQFVPATVNVNTGDKVVWTWQNNDHTTTSGTVCTANGIWDSNVRNTGATFEFTFNTAGDFPYFCSEHCASNFMVGLVRVSTVNGVRDEQNPATTTELKTYPNPFVDNTILYFQAVKAGKAQVEITTMDGKVVTSQQVTVQAGDNMLPISLDVPSGMYLIRLQLEGVLPETRIIIKQEN